MYENVSGPFRFYRGSVELAQPREGGTGELSLQDPDFRRWWGAHHAAVQVTGTKVLHHPIVGRLTLDWSFLTCTEDPDQQLITLTAEPGTPSHDRLRILASWAAQSAGHPVGDR